MSTKARNRTASRRLRRNSETTTSYAEIPALGIKGSGFSENKPQNYKTAYAEVAYPYFTGTGISYGGGLFPIQGIANPDGVAFVAQLNEPTLDPETDGYKYVFALSDGTTLYYYGIPDASAKTLAVGMAIKLPAFDGKGAGTYWKTSL